MAHADQRMYKWRKAIKFVKANIIRIEASSGTTSYLFPCCESPRPGTELNDLCAGVARLASQCRTKLGI